MFYKKTQKNFLKLRSRGFTLYELLISIAIVSIIAGIVLYNHKRFETDVEITNVAYRLALEVRQAQVYSVSVRPFGGTPNQPNFQVLYGLHFNKDVDNSLIFYADTNEDGVYTPTGGVTDADCDQSTGSECIEKFILGRNNRIQGWCSTLWPDNPLFNQSIQECVAAKQNGQSYNDLDIKFQRPHPDAIFDVYQNSDEYTSDTNALTQTCNDGTRNRPCSGWSICLISPQGHKKRVSVYQTGQISVENVVTGSACDSLTN